jgi:trimeric autotransporter adhesin
MPIDPGNGLTDALNLGKFDLERSSVSRNDSVNGFRDPNDYYRFALGTSSAIAIRLSDLTGNADLELRNASGVLIGLPSANAGTADEVITTTLSEGVYYVRVFAPTQANTTLFYNLSVVRTGQGLDPGSTPSLATDLGTFSSFNFDLTEGLANDTVDYYKVELAERRTLTAILTPQQANADLEIRNSADQVIVPGGSSTNLGTAVDRVSLDLNPGVYYIRVFTTPGTATAYRLQVEDTAVDLIGNTPAAAFNFGLLNSPPVPPKNAEDSLGRTDVDFFKFQLNTLSNFSLTLTGLDGDADVELLDRNSNLIARSINAGPVPEAVISRLEAGEYFIRVYPGTSTSSTEFYNLTVFAVPVDSAGFTITDALNITNQIDNPFAPAEFRDWVGEVDLSDMYRFDLDAPAFFNLSLKGLTANADVDVQLWQAGANGAITVVAASTQIGSLDESFNRSLAAGTYYIRVFPAALAPGNTTFRNSEYRMLVSTSVFSNLLPVEKDLGSLSSTTVRQSGTVSLENTADVYRFNLATARSLSLALTGLSSTVNADVRIIRDTNNNGFIDGEDQAISSSFGAGISELFTLPTLAAGQYFVQVYLTSPGSSAYTLALTAGSPTLIPTSVSSFAGSELTQPVNPLDSPAEPTLTRLSTSPSGFVEPGSVEPGSVEPGSVEPELLQLSLSPTSTIDYLDSAVGSLSFGAVTDRDSAPVDGFDPLALLV